MRFSLSIIIFTLLFIAIAAPFSAQAVWTPGDAIVPCDGSVTHPCDFNALIVLTNNIIDFLIYLSVLIAVAMFAYAGFLYLTSVGDTGKMKEAHTIFTNAAYGFIFVLAAWLIVTLILSALASRAFCESAAAKIIMSQEQIDKCRQGSSPDDTIPVVPPIVPPMVPPVVPPIVPPGASVAPIISSVSAPASSITTSNAIISWTTNEASNSIVDYGLTTSYGSQTLLPSDSVTSHYVSLVGLSPNTTYHYRVSSRGATSNNPINSPDYTFTTQPAAIVIDEPPPSRPPPPPPNTPPIFASIEAKTVNENAPLLFTLVATDVNEDTLTYSASGIPTGASFNTSNKTFSWTPSYSQSGNYTVTFSVSDGKDGTDSKAVDIAVTNTLAPCEGINPDFATHAGEQIDSRIRLASPSTGLDLFSDFYSAVGMTGRNFVALANKPESLTWNNNSWTKKGTTLDFTGVAAWNDWGGSSNPTYQGAATLITPKHFVTATHIKLPVGAKVTFIKPNGETVTRTVTNLVDIPNSDVTVEMLDSAVDSSIRPFQVMDIATFWGLFDGIPGSSGVPIALFHQLRKTSVHALGVNYENPYGFIPHNPSSSGTRASFYYSIENGDSGQPGFLIVEDEPVLLFVNFDRVKGSNIGSRITQINQAINSLGSGGYSAELYAPSSCFTKHPITPAITSIYTNIGSISCLQNAPTCSMEILGVGFTPQNNTVRVGTLNIGNFSSYNSGTAIKDIDIPTDIVAGAYDVVVSNSKGTSNAKPFIMLSYSSMPFVASVSPSSGPMGSTITLIGANFSEKHTNNIRFSPTTGFEPEISIQSKNVTQNGTRITITLPNDPNGDYPVGRIFKIWVDNNEFGYSDENPDYESNPATFTVAQ
ncbi:MAG: putative Ig domain-containing protein [Candidatus Paceibacterota bacterium]|jgi:hypothetical protein